MTRKPGRPLARTVGGTPVRRTVLVFTEGRRTEPAYLLGWWRALRHELELEISSEHGTPATLVRLAGDAAARSEREARRGRGDRYDAVWCVFDVDEHPDLDQAVRYALDLGIGVALSNPCIELWFLLHWRDQTAYIDRHSAQAAVAPMIGDAKALDSSAVKDLIDRHDDAAERARRLEARHRDNGSAPRSNPSSSLPTLIDLLRGPKASPWGRTRGE